LLSAAGLLNSERTFRPPTPSWRRTVQFAWKGFVPILYHNPVFDAFDDFRDLLKSISCRTAKSCQVRCLNPCRETSASGKDRSAGVHRAREAAAARAKSGYGRKTSFSFCQNPFFFPSLPGAAALELSGCCAEGGSRFARKPRREHSRSIRPIRLRLRVAAEPAPSRRLESRRHRLLDGVMLCQQVAGIRRANTTTGPVGVSARPNGSPVDVYSGTNI
jgi:hypothetical protein